MKKSIIINLEENTNSIQLKFVGDVNFATLLAATMTALESQAQLLIKTAYSSGVTNPDKIKGTIYDDINQTAALLLKRIAPEYDLHPDLQAEALLRMENQIIEEEFKKKKKDPNYVSPYLEAEKRYHVTKH